MITISVSAHSNRAADKVSTMKGEKTLKEYKDNGYADAIAPWVCPWCKQSITAEQIKNNEVYENGSREQTGGFTDLWHKSCAEKAEEYERENGLRI